MLLAGAARTGLASAGAGADLLLLAVGGAYAGASAALGGTAGLVACACKDDLSAAQLASRASLVSGRLSSRLSSSSSVNSSESASDIRSAIVANLPALSERAQTRSLPDRGIIISDRRHVRISSCPT